MTEPNRAGSWEAWERAREELEKAVGEAQAIARRVRSGADFSALEKATKSLGDHAFRIGVIGDFSNGKSTLINAMIGADLLPSGVLPLTARLAEIRYGHSPAVTLHMLNGDEIEVTYQEFIERNEKLKEAEDTGRPVDPGIDYLKASVEKDLKILRSGVVYVDVPGHNSGFSMHEAIADDAMRGCDALIAVLHADVALRAVESDRLKAALLDLEHRSVFVAVNKLGMLLPGQQEQLIAGFPLRWERFLDSLDLPTGIDASMRSRVYLVDSYNTLQDRIGRGREYVGVEAFTRLERDLAALADGDLIAEKLDRPRRILLRQMGDLRRTVTEQGKLLDVDAEELDAHKEAIDTSIAKLEHHAAEIRDVCERRGIRRGCRDAVKETADGHFGHCQTRLSAWAQNARRGRPAAEGNRLSRLSPVRVRARTELICGELVDRLGRETLRWSETEVYPEIRRTLEETRDLVKSELDEFEGEVRRTWQNLLSGTGVEPPKVSVVDPAMEELVGVNLEELPLGTRPVGVVALLTGEVRGRIRSLIRMVRAAAEGEPDPGDLGQAAQEIVETITEGVAQLKSMLVGSDEEVRQALDRFLEEVACQVMKAALVKGTGGVTSLADRYANNAEQIVAKRHEALLDYLDGQSKRVRSLYDNAITTVKEGLDKVAEEKAALSHAEERLTALARMVEEGR
ncbi:dynamin family protein [Microbispora bryophytorum]|uniref:dynamin family protein n=1 Tax=Microbispora bryophytorum TaxID=1460882 RepID=UPI003403A455